MEALFGLGSMGVALIAGAIVYSMIDEMRERKGK